jgi:ribosome biogenesis GTPase
MREVGITDIDTGIEITFDQISVLAKECRYQDCKHISEAGCAVINAVDSGILEKEFYNNYLKMEREKSHFETAVHEKRKKEKQFGKIVKDYYKKDIKQRGK